MSRVGKVIRTVRGDDIRVGEQAFMDGRDGAAVPPLTIKRINLWQSVDRRRITGQVRHGARVWVMETRLNSDEGRWYFRVRWWWRTGWVPDVFVSAQRREVLGDLV